MTAQIGDNGGPALDPFAALEIEINDLFDEAKNHLDGGAIETQEQADAIDALADMALKAEQAAESARKAEKAPFDALAKAVQTKWKPLTDKAALAKEAARKALTPWRVAQQAIKDAAAAEAKRIADEAFAAAQAQAAAARASADLAAMQEAEAGLKLAASLDKAATRAAKPAATGLRTYYDAVITDRRAALNHYIKADPGAFEALIQTMAQADTRAGVRNIPGVDVVERKIAA